MIPEIGDGPLNIVVDGRQGAFSPVEPGTPASLQEGRFQIGNLEVALDAATLWEPRPDWDRLRNSAHSDRLPWSCLAWLQAPKAAFSLSFLAGRGRIANPPQSRQDCMPYQTPFKTWEMAGWKGDSFAGGVTDWPAGRWPHSCGGRLFGGVMLWAWLAHSTPRFLQAVFEAVGPHHHSLGGLPAGCRRGQCNAAWQPPYPLPRSGGSAQPRGMLSYGHTSGADTLAGFLWMAAARFGNGSGLNPWPGIPSVRALMGIKCLQGHVDPFR